MVARIYSINLSWTDNYVSFDDSDIMTDYSHGFSTGINRVVEWVKKDGGKQIKISVTNDDPKIPSLKRVQQIAKAGYTIEDKSHMHTWHGYQDKETQSFVYEWLLTANSERLKIIESEDIEEERKNKEAEAYRKTPEARIRRLKAEINQAKSVTAVIGAQGFHMVTDQERTNQIQELQKQLTEVEKELC